LSKYTFKIGLKTGRDKINWIEKQCSRCKTLDKKYIEDNVCPEIPISTILQRYEDALKEARKLYYWIK
jgi:phage FluMu protein Com